MVVIDCAALSIIGITIKYLWEDLNYALFNYWPKFKASLYKYLAYRCDDGSDSSDAESTNSIRSCPTWEHTPLNTVRRSESPTPTNTVRRSLSPTWEHTPHIPSAYELETMKLVDLKKYDKTNFNQ